MTETILCATCGKRFATTEEWVADQNRHAQPAWGDFAKVAVKVLVVLAYVAVVLVLIVNVATSPDGIIWGNRG